MRILFNKINVKRSKRALAALLCLGLISCAQGNSTPLQKACVTGSGQEALYNGHWLVHPVPLAVQTGDFSAGELNTIVASIETWNSFFAASKGFKLYLNNGADLGMMGAGGTRATSATICSQREVGPSNFTSSLMIYKNTSNWTYGSSVMGLTSTCPVSSGGTFNSFSAAVMELNYVNFYRAGTPTPDLQSIVTHELGHLLGLNHSCVGSGCSGAPADYSAAIMFPTFSIGTQKRSLNTNDEGRANCLY